MRRLAATSAAVLSVTAIGTIATASSASAAYSQCASGQFCMWTGNGGTGSFGYTTQDIRQLGSTLDNNIQSIWNRTGSNVSIHTGAGYTDRCSTITPGTQRNLAGTAVNSVSSVNVNASC